MTITLNIHDKYSVQVVAAKDYLMESSPTNWVLLFEADRWAPIKCAILAHEEESGQLVGMASLSPETEQGDPKEAEIIGVWVHRDYRGKGLGSQLVRAAVEEARTRWNKPCCIDGVSIQGLALGKKVAQEFAQKGIPFRVFGPGLAEFP